MRLPSSNFLALSCIVDVAMVWGVSVLIFQILDEYVLQRDYLQHDADLSRFLADKSQSFEDVNNRFATGTKRWGKKTSAPAAYLACLVVSSLLLFSTVLVTLGGRFRQSALKYKSLVGFVLLTSLVVFLGNLPWQINNKAVCFFLRSQCDNRCMNAIPKNPWYIPFHDLGLRKQGPHANEVYGFRTWFYQPDADNLFHQENFFLPEDSAGLGSSTKKERVVPEVLHYLKQKYDSITAWTPHPVNADLETQFNYHISTADDKHLFKWPEQVQVGVAKREIEGKEKEVGIFDKPVESEEGPKTKEEVVVALSDIEEEKNQSKGRTALLNAIPGSQDLDQFLKKGHNNEPFMAEDAGNSIFHQCALAIAPFDTSNFDTSKISAEKEKTLVGKVELFGLQPVMDEVNADLKKEEDAAEEESKKSNGDDPDHEEKKQQGELPNQGALYLTKTRDFADAAEKEGDSNENCAIVVKFTKKYTSAAKLERDCQKICYHSWFFILVFFV